MLVECHIYIYKNRAEPNTGLLLMNYVFIQEWIQRVVKTTQDSLILKVGYCVKKNHHCAYFFFFFFSFFIQMNSINMQCQQDLNGVKALCFTIISASCVISVRS